jgi:predicted phospho-2-dehydro-3-deoxyheptonate aldolase
MSIDGKALRIRRITDITTGRFVIVPMDHGATAGPIPGVDNLKDTIDNVAGGGATAVVLHKGNVGVGLENAGGRVGLIVHLSASTKLSPDPNEKTIVSSVEEALQLGADAVSVHINVGAETEAEMLDDLGEVSQSCREWQVPLLAMMYPRGPEIKDPFDVEVVKLVARLGVELGADIIKTNYTGSIETFREVTRGCHKPVIIAGGAKTESDREVLQMVYDSIQAGGAGVSIGRNVFQNAKVTGITKAIAKIVIDGKAVDEAYHELLK